MATNYQLSEHVSLTELEDEAVLLDLTSGAYYGLNHVGVMLITLLNEGADKTQAENKIAEHYGSPHQQVVSDVTLLIDEMLEQRLLRVST